MVKMATATANLTRGDCLLWIKGGCHFVVIKHEVDAQGPVQLSSAPSTRRKCLPKQSPLVPCSSTWILGRAGSQDGLTKLFPTHPCPPDSLWLCFIISSKARITSNVDFKSHWSTLLSWSQLYQPQEMWDLREIWVNSHCLDKLIRGAQQIKAEMDMYSRETESCWGKRGKLLSTVLFLKKEEEKKNHSNSLLMRVFTSSIWTPPELLKMYQLKWQDLKDGWQGKQVSWRVTPPTGPTSQLWSARGLSNMVMGEFMHYPII